MLLQRDGNEPGSLDVVTGDWDPSVKPYGCTLLALAMTTDAVI